MAKIPIQKIYRPLNHPSRDPIISKSSTGIPLEMRDPEASEYRMHVGLPFNADLITKDIADAMDDTNICVKVFSPQGLNGKQLADPKAVFTHMDKMSMLHESLGGPHEVTRDDFNVYNLIEMGRKIEAGEAEVTIDAMTINQETGKMEPHEIKIPNYEGFINIISGNRMWRKCLSWLPFAHLPGNPRLLFGAGMLANMIDPRWFVNPNRGAYLDTSMVRNFFGLNHLADAAGNRGESRFQRSLLVVNTWWWMPPGQETDVTTLKQPNAYFHRLHRKYVRQLSNRYPEPIANNVSVFFTSVRFLSFIWLVWMSILSEESIFQFDSQLFFSGDTEAADSFEDHFKSSP